jgi:hypothetical protein
MHIQECCVHEDVLMAVDDHGLLREPMSSDPPMFSSSLLLTDRDCWRGASARGAAADMVAIEHFVLGWRSRS